MYEGTELKITPELSGFIYHTVQHVHTDLEAKTTNQITETIVTDGVAPESRRFSAVIPLGVLCTDKGMKKQFNGRVFIEAGNIAEAFAGLTDAIEEQRPKLQQDIKNQVARSNLKLPGELLLERLNRNGQGFSLGEPG